MAEERRKGPPERRRSTKTAQVGRVPEVQPTDQDRAKNPNEAAAIDADLLDASIRERQQQDRGEVF